MSLDNPHDLSRGMPGIGTAVSPFSPSTNLFRAVLDSVSGGFTSFDRDWHITYMNDAAARLLVRMGKTPEDLIGHNLWEVFPEMIGTRIYTQYQRAMSERAEIEFEEYFPPLEAWFQVRLYPSEDGLLAYSHDVTAQKHADEAAAERLRITALSADVGRALTSIHSLREMLQGCTEALVTHLDTAFARIWVLNEAEEMLELEASAGLYTHLDGAHSRVPVGRFKIGLIAQERKPHLTNTVVGDPRVGNQDWARREGMVAFAGYPLVVEDRLVGVVAMFARRPLSETILSTLEAVADVIGIGIQRKQNENALIASREWLSTTLRSIGDGVIATDAAGRVSLMNQVAETLTGWSQREAQGSALTEVFRIVNEKTREPVENPVDKVFREGGIVGLANHTILIGKDGSEAAIDDSAAPIRGANGELQGVVLVFRDVTGQRLAQRQADAQHRVSAALAQAESLDAAAAGVLEAIGETLGWTVGTMWLANAEDSDLQVVQTWASDANPGLYSAFETTSHAQHLRPGQGLPGKVFANGLPLWVEELARQTSFPRRDTIISLGLKTGLAFPLQSDGLTLGVIEFFHTSAQPPDENLLLTLGALGQQIGQFIQRRRAVEAVRASEVMKSAILNAALDCIVSMDDKGRVTEWNPVAERTFGYSRQEALGREMAELIIPPAYHDRHRTGLAHYLETGEGPVLGKRLELTALRRNGSEFPVELAINRISTQQPYFTAFIRDITDRMHSEQELQHTAATLKIEQARQAVIMRYLRATNRAAARIASLLEPLEIAEAAVATLSAEFEAPIVGLWFLDAGRRRLTLAAETGLGSSAPASVGSDIDIMMNAYKIGWVARYGKPYVGPILSNDLQFEQEWASRSQLQWAAVYPLKTREQFYGVLAVFLREEMPIGSSDVMATLATIVTGSLDAAYLVKTVGESAESPSRKRRDS